jgi:hypothetical protein
MYTKQHLNISGRRSITFMARKLASVSNRDTSEETRDAWDQVYVYEIDPDWANKQERENGTTILPYTVGIARCTKWKGGRSRFKVIDANSIEQVLDVVRTRIPVFLREVEEQIKLDNTPQEPLEYEPSRSQVES